MKTLVAVANPLLHKIQIPLRPLREIGDQVVVLHHTDPTPGGRGEDAISGGAQQSRSVVVGDPGTLMAARWTPGMRLQAAV